MTIKALNKAGTDEKAALLLGVTSRTVINYRRRWNIVKDLTGHFYITSKYKS